jgi:ubiquinone/menaquinone biosynthesis C-methylase UbiE
MTSKKYFNKTASRWDKMREGFFSEKVREKAFEVAKVQKGKVACDVGAGTGFISEGLLHLGLKVIAVDQSEQMLLEMKKKFSKFKGIKYILGEAENLPLPDENVDYVFANMCLHHIESPEKGIKEMTRILKVGGKLVITDADKHNFEFLRKEQNDRWMGFKREDVKNWFEKAGLKEVKIDCVGENCCPKSNSGAESASISIFVAIGTKLQKSKGER